MNFGPRTVEADAHRIMDQARTAGVNFFDTANAYGGDDHRGWTEEIIYGWMAHTPNQSGLSALNIRRALDSSLQRLQTDHIDLYQFHHVDRGTPWDEIWQAVDVAVQQGQIIYSGSSNFAGWHIAAAQEY